MQSSVLGCIPQTPVLDRLRGKLQRVICLQDFIQVKKQVMGEMGLHGVGAPLGERRSLILTMCFCMMSPLVFEMRQEPKLADTMISFVESQKGIPSTSVSVFTSNRGTARWRELGGGVI